MKNNIKKTACIALMAILLILTTNVYALTDSFKTNLKVNNSKVKRGDNITVNISLSDISIESGEKGIGAYSAKLDFDSSVLEYLSTNGTDKWDKPFYEEKLIVGNTSDGKVVDTEQSIGTITFKVKEDAKLGETTIKLINFSGSTAETDVNANDSSIKFEVLDKDNAGSGAEGSGNEGGSGTGTGSENESGNGTGTGTETGSQNSVDSGTGTSGESENENGSGSINPNNDSSQDGKTDNGNNENNSNNSNDKEFKGSAKLPKTGTRNMIMDIAIVILFIVAISFAIKLILVNKKMKKQ